MPPPTKPPSTLTIHVNEQPVPVNGHRLTGAQILQAAIDAQVRIELDFILVEELGSSGHTKIIGPDDVVTLNKNSRFTANDGDDDS